MKLTRFGGGLPDSKSDYSKSGYNSWLQRLKRVSGDFQDVVLLLPMLLISLDGALVVPDFSALPPDIVETAARHSSLGLHFRVMTTLVSVPSWCFLLPCWCVLGEQGTLRIWLIPPLSIASRRGRRRINLYHCRATLLA